MATDEPLVAFGRRVKETRKARGLTQQQVADACPEIARSSLANIEVGQQNPTIATVVAIATALGVPVGDLFDPTAPPPPAFDRPLRLGGLRNARARLAGALAMIDEAIDEIGDDDD